MVTFLKYDSIDDVYGRQIQPSEGAAFKMRHRRCRMLLERFLLYLFISEEVVRVQPCISTRGLWAPSFLPIFTSYFRHEPGLILGFSLFLYFRHPSISDGKKYTINVRSM